MCVYESEIEKSKLGRKSRWRKLKDINLHSHKGPRGGVGGSKELQSRMLGKIGDLPSTIVKLHLRIRSNPPISARSQWRRPDGWDHTPGTCIKFSNPFTYAMVVKSVPKISAYLFPSVQGLDAVNHPLVFGFSTGEKGEIKRASRLFLPTFRQIGIIKIEVVIEQG